MVDASYTGLSQITDYSLRQLGSDGIPGGSVQSHVVRAGDTLQTIAQIYFGSPAYWYLIADANGLSGSERLAEGVTLTIPNKVANSANSAQTFKVYNESEIIGSTSPEIRTVAKKKKWYQKLIMIIIIVILIIATIYTAGAASGAWGAAGAGAGAAGGTAAGGAAVAGGTAAAGGAAAGTVAAGTVAAGTVAATTVAAASVGGTIFAAGSALGASLAAGLGYAGALAVAAGVGAATFAAASVLTQGLAVAAGLQEEFSWKAVGKAAVGGAVSGAASFLTAGFAAGNAVANASRTTEIATRVGVETGRQLITDGKINNVAGLIGAAAAGGAFSSWGTAGAFIGNNARSFGAGLSLLESKARGQGDNTMGWVGLATAALFDSGAVSPQLSNASGDLNYRLIALQAIGAGVVSSRLGSEAGTSYFGNALGSEIVETIFGRAAESEAKPGDRLGQFIEQNQPAWEQRQANVDQLVGAFSNPGPVDMSGGVLVADAAKFGSGRVSLGRSYVDAAGNRVQVLSDSEPSIGALLQQAQGMANELTGTSGVGNSGTAARQAASANYRAAQAQATSNLYASGAGDVRDTSPLPEQTLPEITVSAPRMTQAEIYAFDRLNPGAADASTQYDSITPIGEVEGFFTFNPRGRALKGAGTAAFDAWTALPNALRGIGTLASDAVGYAGNAIAPQRSVLTGQPFQYQPQSALLQSIQQQGVQGTLGAGITGLVRNAPGIGLIAALGTPRRDWGNVGAQVFNTGMAGAVASMRGAPVETTSPVDKSWKLKIDGTAQATGNDAAHQIRTYREAIALAKNPDIVSVNLDHGYNRVLGLDPKTISPNRRPDVTAIYSDGRVARVEVQSATDNPAILRSRNAALDAQIRAQGYTPLPPRVVVPTRPPKP